MIRSAFSLALTSRLAVGLILAAGLQARALDSSDVLPAHINSPSVRIGYISGIGQRYTGNGSLMSLTDANSITFDAKKLVSIEPRVQQLIAVLNQFGQQQMGSALTLGTLHINIEPDVNYYAPIHAYGITDKWTVAVGVPIIHYKNNIGLSQEGSNLEAIQAQAGGISPELDSAFDELHAGLVQSAQKELSGKGYKPLQNVDTTFIGDVQLVSLYQVFNNKRTALLTKTTFNLPTGPKDDPDDLTDLSDFGQTSISEGAVLTYMLTPKLRLSGLLTGTYGLPDKIDKRVPTSPDDSLPDISTKQNVNRQIGPSVSVGASTMYWFTQRWSAGAGFDIMTKAADKYWGSLRGSRYDLLQADTNQTSERIRLGVSYDTISAYLAKSAFMPAMISYTYSDTIAGVNIARQTIHELWLTMFF
jgi:hypothetical protein